MVIGLLAERNAGTNRRRVTCGAAARKQTARRDHHAATSFFRRDSPAAPALMRMPAADWIGSTNDMRDEPKGLHALKWLFDRRRVGLGGLRGTRLGFGLLEDADTSAEARHFDLSLRIFFG
jgi:hypothetical protein